MARWGHWRQAGLGLACLALAEGISAAEGWQLSVAAASEYLHRGVSLSDRRGLFQAALSYWHPEGGYGGARASTLHRSIVHAYPQARGDAANLEIDLFAGHGWRLRDDWALDLRATAWLYPDDPAPVAYERVELAVAVAWRERLQASVTWSPRSTWPARTSGARRAAEASGELSLHHPLTRWIDWKVGVGLRTLDVPGRSSYAYASTGMAVQLRHWGVGVDLVGTDAAAERLFGDAPTRTRLVATVEMRR